MPTTKTVGKFTFDHATGSVEGPADYMADRGFARIASIEAGDDPVFNMNPNSAYDPALGMMVSLQTDYAGWNGMRQFNALHDSAR